MTVEPLQRIDRYEILSRISEGGMAVVYHARFEATGTAIKQVALKLIHLHLSQDPEFIGMFVNEMRVAMAMAHRNIVQTFDAGQHGERYYLVMELMNRGSLSRVPVIPLDIAVLIAMEVCAGLSYAHTFCDEPLIHRDISPSNILLSDQGDVKLADFGVAKMASQSTHAISVKGKLSYMAPEQAWGRADTRSDLFALGAVLYRMVTNSPLRPNPTLDQVRSGFDKIDFSQTQARAVPPSLQALIGRCLNRDPDQRPESAARLRELLAQELFAIQRTLDVEPDPLARLRGFFGSLPPIATDPEPMGPARRLAEAVLHIALEVPTHHAPPFSPFQTLTRTVPVGDGDTGLTSGPTSPRLPDESGTVETTTLSAGQRKRGRPVLWALGIFGLLVLALGVVAWTLRTSTRGSLVGDSADATASDPPTRGSSAGTRSPQPDSGASLWPVDAALPDAAPLDATLLDTALPDAAGPDAFSPDAVLSDAASPTAARPTRPKRLRGTGGLDLNSLPFAEVYVDGRFVGETPLQGIRLRAGRHRVKLVNPHRGLSASLTVTISPGQTLRRWVRLDKP